MSDILDKPTVPPTETSGAMEPIKQHRSLWKDVWIQFRNHKGAVVGTIVFLSIVLGVIIGPMLHHVDDPRKSNYRARDINPMTICFVFDQVDPDRIRGAAAGKDAAAVKRADAEAKRAGEWLKKNGDSLSTWQCLTNAAVFTRVYREAYDEDWVPAKVQVNWRHALGTDNYGRDSLAQLMAGGRVSLAVGAAAMLFSIFLGALIGTLAGFFRVLDGPLMRLTDLFLALPIVPLLLVIILVFRDSLRQVFSADGSIASIFLLFSDKVPGWLTGPEAGIFILVVVGIGITSWMQTARIVRGDVLSIKEREFVLAAHSIGTRKRRVITRHILPNVLSSILVSATLGLSTAIITESTLSFLGLGFASDFPTWGRLALEGTNFIDVHPSRAIWPGLAISLTVLSVTYMGDGLRDALDPRMRN